MRRGVIVAAAEIVVAAAADSVGYEWNTFVVEYTTKGAKKISKASYCLFVLAFYQI